MLASNEQHFRRDVNDLGQALLLEILESIKAMSLQVSNLLPQFG
jgi:hypothetical protein